MSEPFALPASAHWVIPSGSDEPGLRVTLSYPAGNVTNPVPLLVLLDGDFLLLTATEFARTVHLVSLGVFPPVAVVGVMRDEVDPLRYVTSRFRDFTPQSWVLPGPFADDNALAWMGMGGATQLLGSLEHQVLPQVGEHLAGLGLIMGDATIGGWSLSGLFSCWAWRERPDLFQHLLAISPSLWWNDASILHEPLPSRPADHRAFVCAGEHEEGDLSKVFPQMFANGPQRELAAMVRNAATFADMASRAGADVDHTAFGGEHHITVQGAALARGMRHIFA